MSPWIVDQNKARKLSSGELTEELDRRTRAALEEEDLLFSVQNRQTSDEALLEYVRKAAEELGRAPWCEDLSGGPYIASRFGGWPQALKAAGLPPCGGKKPKLSTLPIYKRELRHQAKLRRQELEAARNARSAELRERSAAAQETLEQLTVRDMQWGAQHTEDSDEALLDYVRSCAKELGHTPAMGEVLGGVYISQRFGNWGVAIHFAGLPFSKRVKKPKQKAIDAYSKKRRES